MAGLRRRWKFETYPAVSSLSALHRHHVTSALGFMAAAMRAAEVSQARRLAREWLARHPGD